MVDITVVPLNPFVETEMAQVRRENAELKDRVAELLAKIQFVIDHVDLPEGEFTFPDGDTWHRKWR